MKHTPGLLKVVDYGNIENTLVFQDAEPCKVGNTTAYESGQYVAICYDTLKGKAKDHAEHLKDCVNACEGINPRAVPDMREALIDAIQIIHELTDYETEPGQLNYAEFQEQALAQAEGRV